MVVIQLLYYINLLRVPDNGCPRQLLSLTRSYQLFVCGKSEALLLRRIDEACEVERVELKSHPIYNERWLQDIIIDDPAILPIGDVVVKDTERRQARAGRADLLACEKQYQSYRIKVNKSLAEENKELLKELLGRAYKDNRKSITSKRR